MKRSLGRNAKFFCAAVAAASIIAISTPIAAYAEDEPIAPTSSHIQTTNEEGQEDQERGVRIGGDFDASHPSEWIAIGVAIALAITLAYTAKRRKKRRE